MFCPSAIEWGNIADWFSGTASMLAVAAALAIAVHQTRRSNKLDRAKMLVERQRRNSLIDEAIGLIEEASRNATSFAFKMDVSHSVSTTLAKREYTATQSAVGARMLQLQAMEQTNPGVFTELGYVAALCSVDGAPERDSDSSYAMAARSLAEKLGRRAGLLEEIRAILNEADSGLSRGEPKKVSSDFASK